MTDTDQSSDVIGRRPESIFGLSRNLWRLALVVGVAQFSWSIWGWQFAIFLETIIEPWQMGLTFSIGIIASILGFPLSGMISDMLGRKKTMALAFMPMMVGLVMLSNFPSWPYIPFYYALTNFGWSFVLISARAMPADEIAQDDGRDAAKRFTMVLMPAFLVDGFGPMVGAMLLTVGFESRHLMLLGAAGALIAMIATLIVVRESLGEMIQEKARTGPKVPLRELGGNFWKLVSGMALFYFAFNLAVPYLGNLATDSVSGWGLDTATFGFAWSAFSLTGAIMIYVASSLADKNVKVGLSVALICNAAVFLLLSEGAGVVSMILLNIVWAFPVMTWIGAERALIVADVSEQMKGRALGYFAVIMNFTYIFGAPLGAWIWATSGSLRFLYFVSSVLCFVAVIPAVIAFRLMRASPEKGEDVHPEDTMRVPGDLL
ncbi:MAG: MFS transporter [Candidatus Thorarchaeota archaeon]|jgi:MFS family permease